MKFVVTGGCGFIGSHLVDRLAEVGNVRVIDLPSASQQFISHHKSSNVEFVKADIRNDLGDSFQNADTVFHMAACADVRIGNKDPGFMYDVNITGMLNVLEHARKHDVKKVVFASSSVVYGNADVIPTPETHVIKPVSFYGFSKAVGEALLKTYSDSYGISGTAVRYANVFGPRSGHGVMFDFFHKMSANPKQLEILGNGNQRKSYVFIDDVIDATLLAEKHTKGFDVFNIGTEEMITVNEIADEMASALKISGLEKIYTGGERGWEGDVSVTLLDTSKLKKLGWNPKTKTKDGIRKYVEWLSSSRA